MAKKKPIVVKKWIESGELNPDNKRMSDILEECGALMDGCEATEILGGGILFKATNGKYYTITIEAIVGEANPAFVKDTLAEKAGEQQRSCWVPKRVVRGLDLA